MERYFKVKEKTDAWERFNDIWTWESKWTECHKQLEEFLGFEYEENLYLDNETLTINPKVLKEEWKDQFKKNSYPAIAKKNSKINKKWVELCNSLGLKVYKTTIHISLGLGIYGKIETLFPPMNGTYYFKGKTVNTDWSKFEWVEEVNASEFLRIRAAWLENSEESQIS
jgi:hypothetical protein